MEKLQYDSFYKFLVSLGVILITLPILAMAFIATGDVVLISQAEYENLSSFSQNAIQQKEELLNFISNWLPLITKIFIPLGAIFILAGGGRWLYIQLQLDDQIKSDTIMKKINAKNMSADEIVGKALGEVSETENKESNNSETTTPNIPYTPSENPVVKYMRIENLCFSKAINEYSRDYHLKKNIRVGKHEYDFVAVSKKDNIDLLFEVKYWRTCSTSRILELINKLYSRGIDYENTAHRNFRIILMLVTPKQELEKLKQHIETKLVGAHIAYKVDIQYIAEEDLN